MHYTITVKGVLFAVGFTSLAAAVAHAARWTDGVNVRFARY